MRLHIAGHNHKRGYAVSRVWSDAECSALPPGGAPDDLEPVRFIQSRKRVERFVQRWNRLYATHWG